MKNQGHCFILIIKNLVEEYKLKKDVQVSFGDGVKMYFKNYIRVNIYKVRKRGE